MKISRSVVLGWAGLLLIAMPLNAVPFLPDDARAAARADRIRPPDAAQNWSFIDNGVIRIGVDLSHGGGIGYLADAGTLESVINVHDLGRYVGQSYYSGPQPYGDPHPAYPNWPWNPVSAGDVYGHAGAVLAHENRGDQLYTLSQPKQWALNDQDCDCLFETWITLEGTTARVRNRLTNRRAEPTQYRAYQQELPAVYTIGRLHRLFTYDGPAPFTQGPLRQVPYTPPPWARWTATEHWAALVNNDDWGLGVFHPGVYSFLGGFAGPPDRDGPEDPPTGYIVPLRFEILDYNIVYQYEYVLILGCLEDIRSYAYQHRPKETKPDYYFDNDRRHWWYVNAADTGLPTKGALRVLLDRDDPQMIGPEGWWDARDVPRLYLRAAFRTTQNQAQLFWSVPGQGFSESRSVRFSIIPDGAWRTYEIPLYSVPAYQGTITGLRFDPVPSGGPGEFMDITSLTYRPPTRKSGDGSRSPPANHRPRNGRDD